MNQLIQYLINHPSDEFTIPEMDLKDINDFYTPLHAFKHLIPETPTSTLKNYVFSHDKVIEKFSAIGFEVRYNDLKREFYIRKPNKKQILETIENTMYIERVGYIPIKNKSISIIESIISKHELVKKDSAENEIILETFLDMLEIFVKKGIITEEEKDRLFHKCDVVKFYW